MATHVTYTTVYAAGEQIDRQTSPSLLINKGAVSLQDKLIGYELLLVTDHYGHLALPAINDSGRYILVAETDVGVVSSSEVVGVEALLRQIACAQRCNISQRLARRLLAVDSVAPRTPQKCTQERFSRLLGVRRQSINQELGIYARARAIHLSYSEVTVLDRQALAAYACEHAKGD